MKKIMVSIGLCFLSLGTVNSQTARKNLSKQLEEIAHNSDLPGFAVAIVSTDSILYQRGLGLADIKDSIPFTEHTVLNIGSISKTLISIALMQLVEKGKLSLDDEINQFLPFEVQNPHFPNEPITIRQLATHTSSLCDGSNDMLIELSYLFQGFVDFKEEELPQDYYPYFQTYKSNKPISMAGLLESVYSKQGNLYSQNNFLRSKPGTEYYYTNLGATLLAFIIERLSQTSFADHTQKEILLRLGMHNSYWALTEIPENKLASLYMANGLKIPHYMLITYPDGGLFTSVSDFSYFLRDMISGLQGKGALLSRQSYKEMMSNQLTAENFPYGNFNTSKGLMWYVNQDEDNISMNGADPGIATYTLFTTSGNVGIIIFMNTSFYGNESLESDFFKIRQTLFQSIAKLLKKN